MIIDAVTHWDDVTALAIESQYVSRAKEVCRVGGTQMTLASRN